MTDYFSDEEESNDNIDVKNDIFNYKGYFVENEEEEEKKFYEFGAHFPYKYLYQRLEIIAKEREEKRKNIEKKIKNTDHTGANQVVKNKSITKDNLKGLLNIFQQNGKSRNREEVGNGNELTYMPQMKKNKNNFNYIDNVEINLVKSTSGKNQSKTKNKKIGSSNNSSNAFSNKFKENKKLNRNKNKSQNNQMKIRKRNYPNNMININNSLYSNVNIFSKHKLFDKGNQKYLTQDIQLIYKIKNNTKNKYKSYHNSKDKKCKKMLNDFRTNNIYPYKNCFGYLNTKIIIEEKK